MWFKIYIARFFHDEKKICLLHLFYFIFPLYDILFIDYDLLHIYLYLLFHFSFNCEEDRDIDLCFG